MAESKKLNVLVWDEYPAHAPKELYPEGIRGAVAEGLRAFDVDAEFEVKTVGLEEADQGVSEADLKAADVLLWWGHARHGEVEDALAERIASEVKTRGLGFICLHSGHYSKPFRTILDAPGHLKGGWRESDDTEEITVAAPWHPIAKGVEDFVIEAEEMYGGPFTVPPHEVLVLQSYFPKSGDAFPSGIVWTVGEGIDPEFTSGPGGGVGQGRGVGRVFYFRPGHETYKVYYDERVRRILYNAVRWAGKLVS